MKRLFPILIFLALALPLPAAHVLVDFADFGLTSLTNRNTVLTLQGTNIVSGQLISREAKEKKTAGTGQAYFSNSVAGYYKLELASTPPTVFWLNIPDTNGVVSAAACAVASTNAPGNLVAYSQAAANARFLPLPTNNATASNGQVVSKTGDNTKYIDAGGGGSATNVNFIDSSNIHADTLNNSNRFTAFGLVPTNGGTIYDSRLRFTADADTAAGLSVSNAANTDANITFNDQLQLQGGYLFNGVVQSASGFYGNTFGDLYGPMRASTSLDTNLLMDTEGGSPIMVYSVGNDGIVFPRSVGGNGQFLTNLQPSSLVGIVTNASIPVFPSVAAMISAGLSNEVVEVVGYWGTNTWGGGRFRLRTGVTLATNYGTIFTNKTGATGTAGYRERVRESTNAVNVADFGIFSVVATDPAGALVRQDARLQNAIDCVPISGGRVIIPPFNFNIGTIYLTNKFGCEIIGEAGGGRGSLYTAQTRPVIGYNGPAGATNWILHGSGNVTFRNIGFDTRPTVHANLYPTLLTNYAQIIFDVDQPASHAFTTTQIQWENCKFNERGTNTNLRFVRFAYGSWQNCEFMRFKNCSFSGNGWKGDYWYAYTNTGGIAISCGEGGGGANSFGNVIEDCDFDSCYSYLSSSNGTWSVRGGYGTGGVVAFAHSGAGPMIINNDFRDEGARQFVVAPNAMVHIADCQIASVEGWIPLPVIDATSVFVENTLFQGTNACYVTNSFTSTGFLVFERNQTQNLNPATALALSRFGSHVSVKGSFSTYKTKNWIQSFPLSTWDATLGTNKMVLDYAAGATPSLLLMPDHGRLGFGRTPLAADFWINSTNTGLQVLWSDATLNPRYQWNYGNVADSIYSIFSKNGRTASLVLSEAQTPTTLSFQSGFGRNDILYSGAALFVKAGTTPMMTFTGDGSIGLSPTNPAGYYDVSIAGSNVIHATQGKTTLSNAVTEIRGTFTVTNSAIVNGTNFTFNGRSVSVTNPAVAGEGVSITSAGFIGDGSQLSQLNANNFGSGVLASTKGGAGTVNGVLSADGAGNVSASTSAQIQTALGGQVVTNGHTASINFAGPVASTNGFQWATNGINTGILPVGKTTFTNITGNITIGGFSGVDASFEQFAKLRATNSTATDYKVTLPTAVCTATNAFVIAQDVWVTNKSAVTISFEIAAFGTNAAAVRFQR